MKKFLLFFLWFILPATACAQTSVLQGGNWSAGRTPMYSTSGGGSQPVVQQSAPASGGAASISELSLIARGTGTAPYVGQGTGFLGSILCLFDGPTTGAHHELCLSPNATGGTGLISYNAYNGASAQALTFNVNGSNVTALTSIAVGATAITSGTTGRVLYDAAGVLGEMTTSGDGTQLALTSNTTFTGVTTLNRASFNGGFPTQTATITIASPAVVTATAHGFQAGSQVIFATTSALPTGITAGTVYYVLSAGLTANTFRFSATSAGAAINTSGSQSGTQTISNTLVNISGSLFLGDPTLSYQADISPGNGGLIVRNDSSPYIIQRNMGGGCIPHQQATDADDLDGYYYTCGSSAAGILSGARGMSIGANFGNFGIWSNLSAGSAAAKNLLTILGPTVGANEGYVAIGASAAAGAAMLPTQLLTVARDGTPAVFVTRAAQDFGLLLYTVSSSGNSFITSVGGGSTLTISPDTSLVINKPTSLTAALTYGGVTLTNGVTGTGSMVLGTAPTLSSVTITGAASIGTNLLGNSSAPGVSSCGTSPSVTTGSTNMSGEFTTGTGTPASCTITFANAFPTASFCVVTGTNAAAIGTTVRVGSSSTTAFSITLGAGTSSAAFHYVCLGK